MSTPSRLLVKKVVLAFFLGAAPVFLYSLLGVLDSIAEGGADFSIVTDLIIAALVGATSAGIRGLLAYFTDWMPTDSLHGTGNTPESVVVTTES
jgi:hypothetical protein